MQVFKRVQNSCVIFFLVKFNYDSIYLIHKFGIKFAIFVFLLKLPKNFKGTMHTTFYSQWRGYYRLTTVMLQSTQLPFILGEHLLQLLQPFLDYQKKVRQ